MANPYPLLTFQQLYKELTGEISPLPDLQAMRLVNRAWKYVNDYRMWSWQIVSNAQLFIPAVITQGTAAATYQSTTVQMDASAQAAINSYVSSGLTPPLFSPVFGIGMQIRLGTANIGLAAPTGPNYSIVNYDTGTGIITIDQPYGQNTASLMAYQILKCYYAAPFLPVAPLGTTDIQFSRFLSVTDVENGYTIAGRQLYFSQEELNRIDPQRGGQGQAYIMAYWGKNTNGQPVYEMYPNPVPSSSYEDLALGPLGPDTLSCNYVTKGPLLTMTTGLPAVSYALDDAVIFRAKKFAGQWALANVGRYPKELGQVNWVAYIQMMEEEFKQSFRQCVKEDDEIMPSPKPFVYNGGFSFPLGGEFLQSHDISSILPPM
jgi:hypothetical protein